jgi:hypothetical protein
MKCDEKISGERNDFERIADQAEHPDQEKNVQQRYFFLTACMPCDKNIKKGFCLYGVL